MNRAFNRQHIRSVGVAAALALYCWLSGLVRAEGPATNAAPQVAKSALEMLEDADQLYQEGNWEAALKAFQDFSKMWGITSTHEPRSMLYQAWCLANLGKYPEALAVLQKMKDADPKFRAQETGAALLKEADIYRELGSAEPTNAVSHYAKARELYRKAGSLPERRDLFSQAVLGEAWMLFTQSQQLEKDDKAASAKLVSEAKELINKVLSSGTADSAQKLDALFALGQMLAKEKKYDEARDVFKKIAGFRNNPGANPAIYFAAETMRAAGQYPEAIRYYERVQAKGELTNSIARQIKVLRPKAQVRPELRKELAALRALYEQVSTQGDLRPAALFRIANCFQLLSRAEEASVVYQQFIRVYGTQKLPAPNDTLTENAAKNLIQMYTARGQGEKAKIALDNFKKDFPNSPIDDLALSEVYTLMQASQFNEALEKLLKLKADAKKPELLEVVDFQIASCHFGLEQFEKARDEYTEFIEEHKTSQSLPDAQFRLSRCYFKLSQLAKDAKAKNENLAKAIEIFETLRANPGKPPTPLLPEVVFQLGYLYSFLGELDKANWDKSIAAFEEFVKTWPTFKDSSDKLLAPEALYQIAHSQFGAGRYDKAVEAYDRLIAAYPENELTPYGAFEKADVLGRAKKYPEMMKAYEDFIKKYPTHPKATDAMLALADALYDNKQNDKATELYRSIIERAAAAGANASDDLRKGAITSQLRIIANLESQNKIPEAVAECEQFLTKFSADGLAARTVVGEIGRLFLRSKNFEDGYTTIEKLGTKYLGIQNIRVGAWTALIELALIDPKTDRGLAQARTAVAKLLAEKDSLPAPTLLAVGTVQLKLGNYQQASETFTKMMKMEISDERLNTMGELGLAQSWLQMKKYTESEPLFRNALKKLPADIKNVARQDAQLGLADNILVAATANNFENKAQLDEIGQLLNPVALQGTGDRPARACLPLATIQLVLAQRETDRKLQMEKYTRSLNYWNRLVFIGKGPVAEEASFRQGQCQEGLGDTAKACANYRAYLKRFANSQLTDSKGQLFTGMAKERESKICGTSP